MSRRWLAFAFAFASLGLVGFRVAGAATVSESADASADAAPPIPATSDTVDPEVDSVQGGGGCGAARRAGGTGGGAALAAAAFAMFAFRRRRARQQAHPEKTRLGL
jgi:hypothetical protein